MRATCRRCLAKLDRRTGRQGACADWRKPSDQKAFARLTRAILKDFEMGDDLGEKSDGEGDESDQPEPQSEDGGETGRHHRPS